MIYCDLDGVLADFNRAFKEITGRDPDDVSKKTLWKTVLETPNYWLNLKLMPDAKKLIRFLKKHPFTILTGIPQLGHTKAVTEKRQWVTKHLGADIPVICCYSADKKHLCKPNDILIDDFDRNIQEWETAGGITIHHVSVADTLRQLKEMGY